MTRILWATSLALLLSPSAVLAQQFDAYGFAFDANQPSHCYVLNVSTVAMVKGCLVQNMRNTGNPVDVGHGVSRLLLPGEWQELTYAVRTDLCGPVQIDGLDNLLPWQTSITRWTESDIANNHVSALGQMLQLSACGTPPSPPQPPSPPEPPQPPPPTEPACVSRTFTFGGSPTIARFPDGYPDPWFPESVGPFYFYVPMNTYGYLVTAWSGDNHVGPDGKYDGTQDHEIGSFVFDNGWVLGPTNDVPDDVNAVFTNFGVRGLISPLHSFYFRHAGPTNPPSPTDSVFPIQLTFTCVEGGQ